MASKPGILTDWPWKSLGSFKYGILVPWVVHSIYSYSVKGEEERDFVSLLHVPFMLSRIIHNQIWITLSRYGTAKGNNLIVVDKGIEFDQVDRESNWDDQIILITFLYYLVNITHSGASRLPLWRTDGVILTILLHMGPVEYLYYWFHRALHHHYLYSRYHSHHHSSIVTQPISSVIHPFAEMIVYMLLFAIPLYTLVLTGTASLAAVFGYVTYIDFMNNMGHCNFELVPSWIFTIFPPLKYLMYTPSFHSLHHTQFRTNYSLFMPFYDYMYGTVDKSSDLLYQASRNKIEETPDVVHLTHLTTLQSIYHLRIGFGSLASKPFKYNWFTWMMWPFTSLLFIFTWFFDCKTFISEKHTFGKLIIQSWVLPKYNIQFSSKSQKETINSLIEEAIIEADSKGVKVLSLGLLNQDEELNGNGEFYIKRNPYLKIKVVDGSSLAMAVVLNNIPNHTTQVLLRGNISKMARALTLALCQRGIQVATLSEDKYKKLKVDDTSAANNLVLTESYNHKVWVVGEGFNKEDEQLKAPKGTIFIPFSKFPMKKIRKDCYYLTTPAMMTPPSLRNQHSCENWLPRRAMSAWRVAGIVHALEDWNVNECGRHTITMSSVHKVWEASLHHGFRPIQFSPNPIN